MAKIALIAAVAEIAAKIKKTYKNAWHCGLVKIFCIICNGQHAKNYTLEISKDELICFIYQHLKPVQYFVQ